MLSQHLKAERLLAPFLAEDLQMGLNETPSAGETQVDEGAIAGRAVARFVRDWRLGVAEAQVRFQEKNLHFLLKDLHLCIKT